MGNHMLSSDVLKSDELRSDVRRSDVLRSDVLRLDGLRSDVLRSDVLRSDTKDNIARSNYVLIIIFSNSDTNRCYTLLLMEYLNLILFRWLSCNWLTRGSNSHHNTKQAQDDN